MSDPFEGLPRNHFGAILADPPWQFMTLWGTDTGPGNRNADYSTMSIDEICDLPIDTIAARDCVLFIWGIWIFLPRLFEVIEAWGFEYKTCAFDWMKARADQIDMFRDDCNVQMGLGYWTRANSEPCLLGTRGKPKRLNADVRQGIIAPRREHSRKPDGIHERIERLVAGPYLELFARQSRPGWTTGNEKTKFDKPNATVLESAAVSDPVPDHSRRGGVVSCQGGEEWEPTTLGATRKKKSSGGTMMLD